MKIITTANEAIDLGIWDNLCKMREINVWAVNEGLMDGDEEILLDEKEAVELGIYPHVDIIIGGIKDEED